MESMVVVLPLAVCPKHWMVGDAGRGGVAGRGLRSMEGTFNPHLVDALLTVAAAAAAATAAASPTLQTLQVRFCP
jgi:hypothetical protein